MRRNQRKVMTSVRIAGNAGSKAAVVKDIANHMQIAAWIHSVSSNGPAEEWKDAPAKTPSGAPVRA